MVAAEKHIFHLFSRQYSLRSPSVFSLSCTTYEHISSLYLPPLVAKYA